MKQWGWWKMKAGDRFVYQPVANEFGIVHSEFLKGQCGTIRYIGPRYTVVDFDSGPSLYVRKQEWLQHE